MSGVLFEEMASASIASGASQAKYPHPGARKSRVSGEQKVKNLECGGKFAKGLTPAWSGLVKYLIEKYRSCDVYFNQLRIGSNMLVQCDHC